MDDQRVGRVVRALRRRRGWRQVDLADEAGCSQSMISLVERGHLDRVALRAVRRIMAALDATLALEVRWRAGALDRLLDEEHALLVGAVARRLRDAGWLVETEVTYAHYGENGSYDILAFRPALGLLLAVEVKTDLPSVELTLRKLDEKARLAPIVARQRFAWSGTQVSRLLVMPEERSLRRRVNRHVALFDQALPARSVAARGWIAAPSGVLAGLWFLTPTNRRGVSQRRGGSQRVRRPTRPADTTASAA